MEKVIGRNLVVLILVLASALLGSAESDNPFPYVKRKCFKICYDACLAAPGGRRERTDEYGCPPGGPFNAMFKECYYQCMTAPGGENGKCGYNCWYGVLPPGAFDVMFTRCKDKCNAELGPGSNETCGIKCWSNGGSSPPSDMIMEKKGEEMDGRTVEYLMELA